jgi:hypothetical protein
VERMMQQIAWMMMMMATLLREELHVWGSF